MLGNWCGFLWNKIESGSVAVGNGLNLWGGRCGVLGNTIGGGATLEGGSTPGGGYTLGDGSTLGGGPTLGGGVCLGMEFTRVCWVGMGSGVVATGCGISEAVSGFQAPERSRSLAIASSWLWCDVAGASLM